MKSKSRPKVALIVETSRSYGRNVLRGVASFAQSRTNWSLLHQEMTLDMSLPAWLSATHIQGVIVRADKATIGSLRQLNVPLIDVRCHEHFEGIPQIETDDQLVAKLAFDHLWDRGFRRFAFCGFQHAHYSATRLRFFKNLVAGAGCPLSYYETPTRRDLSLTQIEQCGVNDESQLSEWLRSLTPPTGLFVCNDIRGQQVLNACRTLDVAIPDDIAVIGVDDDDVICPLTDPPLSSVRPDAEMVGYRAAEILQEMINGLLAPESIEYVPPTSVVQRLSTQVIAIEDREVARVCKYIRDHACDGIDVHDVAEFTTLSRRQLERRFRSELGGTPHDEIVKVQIARVEKLLRETTLTLEQIAPLAGYSHKEHLSKIFKRRTGKSPGEYRRHHAAQK
tara:strand:+ start:13172 stop:14350 length:1179 start_codon:yes stop_codon:yes gene_type:complete